MTPEIVLGPPGTGKTTRLLSMVEAEMASGTPPDRVGYLSFTRHAAEEARGRACEKFRLSPGQLPYFRTIHSLCFRVLGLSSSDVLEGPRLVEFGDWIGAKVSSRVSMDEGSTFGYELGDRCLHLENMARVRGVSLRQQYEDSPDDLPWPLVERVARGLEEYKKAKHLSDFTDMLSTFADRGAPVGLHVLFVDEAQDLSMLQWRAVDRLAEGCRRVVVAGDDDQAIYRWAGAAVEHFVRLPGVATVLEQSWRVPRTVQEVAGEPLRRIKDRREKSWLARPEAGVVRRVGSLDELDFDAGRQVLILARNSCFLRDDAAALLRSLGVVYEMRGYSSVRQTVVDAVLDWERLRRGEAVLVSEIAKVYELMVAGEGYARGNKKLPSFTDRDAPATMDDLRARGGLLTNEIWHRALTRITAEERVYMVKALRRGEKFTRRPTVKLSTIHGSKGGQAPHVILLRDMAWRSYQEMQTRPEDEARCFYVACTRAQETLTIVSPQTRRSYDV